MKKLLIITTLLASILSNAQEKYNPLAKPNTYRNADNPNYWKNKMPHAGYWQQDVHYRIKASIEETKDILDFVFSFVEAVGKAKKDGEMSWSDARYFIDPVKKLFEAVDDIEEVLPEIEDLSEEEYDQLVEYVKGKWNYDEENLDWVVDTAIEAGRGVLTLINMQKS